MLRQFVSIFLLLNILFTDAGVSIYKRTCLRSGLESVSMLTESCSDDVCCTSDREDNACCKVTKKDCCDSQFSYVKSASAGFKNQEPFQTLLFALPISLSELCLLPIGHSSPIPSHAPLLIARLQVSFTQVIRC